MNPTHLSDLELLGHVIGVREAQQHYKGALTPLFKASLDGSPALIKLIAAQELFRRWLAEELHRPHVMTRPGTVSEYLRSIFAGLEHESFVMLCLDSQHRLIASEELSRGTIDAASVYPREVVKAALRHNAAAVIFAHNHPSGVAEPSVADRMLTERLKSALSTIEVRVLDHFVIGGTGATSFAERGLL